LIKVMHPTSDRLDGGIKTSLEHQKEIYERSGNIELVESFSADADLLHVNVVSPRSFLQMKRAKRHGVKTVVHAHEIGENFGESFRFSTLLQPVVRRYVDIFYRRADLVLTPSEYARKELEKRGIDSMIRVVSNGIDGSRFEDQEPVETEEFTVVNLALVFERKGVTDFIETGREVEADFRWYGKRYSNLLLDEDIGGKIEGSPENVKFLGFIDRAVEAFNQADVFFFPTKSETEGLSVLEAAYCGVPVVIRDIPVYENIFEHGENCLKGEGPKDFMEQIQRLKKDPELRQRLGENARKVAESRTLDSVQKKYENHFKELVNR
jgi:1,2-diacylglycerol-3-alpha-glucose alpha-1,2-glucosyltransferase